VEDLRNGRKAIGGARRIRDDEMVFGEFLMVDAENDREIGVISRSGDKNALGSGSEMGGGFVDLDLEPFLARYPDMRFGYLIELKYIARSEYNQVKLQEKIDEAKGQFVRYSNDERIRKVADQVPLKHLILVYNGWELAYREEWTPEQVNRSTG
jgi:hypothetical protein